MEQKNSSDKKWIGAGLLAAVAASLCCITPVLAVLGGLGGIASTFSWLDPLRPYLIGFTVIILGYAFYTAYKPKKEGDIDCACDDEESPAKKNFLNSKAFLWVVTGVSVLMFAFPSYSHIFFPETNTNIVIVNESNITEAKLYIEGMTCTGCEESVNYILRNHDGVISAVSSYETGIADVKFDKSRIKLEQLARVIEDEVGYKVKSYEIIKDK
ncbi:MAG: mercuric transport protein MerTP [Bacteroidetes bacterium]|nr:mercuric transport protein MerTP [Bacteroidota bacterium]